MKKSYFNSPQTIEVLRRQYKTLLKKYHPDCGGTAEDAAAINNEYENLYRFLKDRHEDGTKQESDPLNYGEEWLKDAAIRATIQKIIGFEGIEIEICGTWVWLSGNTYTYKDALKGIGFKFAGKKKMWYWHEGEYKKSSRRTASMESIREKYGSESVKTQEGFKIA